MNSPELLVVRLTGLVSVLSHIHDVFIILG